MNKTTFYLLITFVFFCGFLTAQVDLSNNNFSYEAPKTYTIGGVSVEGVKSVEPGRIKEITGLFEGEQLTVPSDKIAKAIENLWELDLFSDVQILSARTVGSNIFLQIVLVEKERLSRFAFKGVKKSEADNLREKLELFSGKMVDEHVISRTKTITRNYFIDKGFYDVKVDVAKKVDTLLNNSVFLSVNITKGERIKIENITIEGNTAFKTSKLKRKMKGTKEKSVLRIFSPSKYIPSEYKADKNNIIELYYSEAYRDAKISFDTVYYATPKTLNINIKIDEGSQYKIRNIEWVGNSLYRSSLLDTILDIKKGDLYSKTLLESRLSFNPSGRDISSLYQDKGYLFFQAIPVEKTIVGDSVDLEIRVYEGKQARINRILIMGNTRTSDHVILREVRTMPGDLYNRNDLIRTQRELMNLTYFNQEKLATEGIVPIPDPVNGTVDIQINVEETSTDQIELSGGYGMNRFIGSLGVTFNNFSIKNITKKGTWTPLPSGDGQRLSLRAQSTGVFFQSYNISFSEPWLGGKKPTSLTLSAYHSRQSNGINRNDVGHGHFYVTGAALGIGKRVKWPDDYFTIYLQLPSYQYYDVFNFFNSSALGNGFYNNINAGLTIARNSVDAPIYPRSGSTVSLSMTTTPPFGLLDDIDDYSEMTSQKVNKWIDYNKIKFTSAWYTTLSKDKKLVFYSKIGFGFLNPWDRAKGVPPVERFKLGGTALTNFNMFGEEIIALRGYDASQPIVSSSNGDPIIAKYTMELRYPVSLNPQATLWGHVFFEAGNTWRNFGEFNPFQVKRAAGFGAKIYLPMFGLIGLDYGWGFDAITNPNASGFSTHTPRRGYFQFTLGMNLGEL
jgi:outer membrane protein insertion porin family